MRVDREWAETKSPDEKKRAQRVFITSLSGENDARLGKIVREHWTVENKNHHKRDDSVWQEDRHRHRRANVALNLALTRNALLAIIPFDENHNLPSLIEDYQKHPSRAINLILKARPIQ